MNTGTDGTVPLDFVGSQDTVELDIGGGGGGGNAPSSVPLLDANESLDRRKTRW